MDVREKLVELLERAFESFIDDPYCIPDEREFADHLIAHGVTVQENCKACGEATQNCIVKLQEQIAELRSVQEWISVNDRLPENDAMVIGYTPCDGFMFVGYYHEEPKYDWKVWRIVTAMRSTKVMTKKVTHWMPLPQPPKGE